MKKTKGKLRTKLMAMTLMPLFIMSGIIIAFTYTSFYSAMQKEVQHELKSMAETVLNAYDQMYEGDYTAYTDGENIVLKKGENILSGEYGFLDRIKWETGIDITFFYYDVRVLTTLKGDDKERYIGTVPNATVVNEVLKHGNATFYERVLVEDIDYFAYYSPVYNPNGSCVGMIFAGKPSDVVKKEIARAVSPVIYIGIVVILFSGLLCHSFTREMVTAIQRIKVFLRDMSQGNLKTELDSRIIQRNDELGEMGRFTARVQIGLREMIERDALTKLYCRRIGEKRLRNAQADVQKHGSNFAVAIADIDFFKKFNDTYGHDCGDLVLIEIAKIFNQEMLGKGAPVRWGGEEFLLLYEDRDMKSALVELEKLRKKVLELEIPYNDELLKVTMTFGITQGSGTKEIKDIVKRADELLYEGKMNGRNQIVADDFYMDN